jgi:hypothetical protein
MFFRPDSFFSRLVAKITRSTWSHVGIWVPRAGYFEATRQGVRWAGIPPAPGARAGVTLDARGLAFLWAEVGKEYSFSTILADLLNAYLPALKLEVYQAGEYVCSALVAEALHIDDAHLQTPGSLAALLGAQ